MLAMSDMISVLNYLSNSPHSIPLHFMSGPHLVCWQAFLSCRCVWSGERDQGREGGREGSGSLQTPCSHKGQRTCWQGRPYGHYFAMYIELEVHFETCWNCTSTLYAQYDQIPPVSWWQWVSHTTLPDASRAVNTSGHDSFHKWTHILIFDSSAKNTSSLEYRPHNKKWQCSLQQFMAQLVSVWH